MSSAKRTGKGQVGQHGGPSRASEDTALWEEVTKSVTPLTLKNPKNTISATKTPSVSEPNKQAQPNASCFEPFASTLPAHPSFEHGKAPGLDRKTQTRMRRGQVQIEGRLDLHGMTQTQAHRVLLNFLEDAYYGGRRSVLVITGKGLTRDGEIGVLRRAVPRWLNEPPMSAWIKGFDYAARQHGGEGAIYVLIRRKR